MVVISDIDGVLADPAHRISQLRQRPIDWVAISRKIPQDRPIKPSIEILRSLAVRGYTIHLFTGRSQESESATKFWLNKWKIPYASLTMRDPDDYSPNYALKQKWVRSFSPDLVLFILEDSPMAIKIYLQLGYFAFAAPRTFTPPHS